MDGPLRFMLKTDLSTSIPPWIVDVILKNPPFESIQGVNNFRNFTLQSGFRKGYVYRSARLNGISELGKSTMANDLGVTTIFDLRDEGEIGQIPSPVFANGISTISLPYATTLASLKTEDFDRNHEETRLAAFCRLYIDITKALSPIFRLVFTHIKDRPDDPFVFHCSLGKDRTGVLAALILLLAGSPANEIIDDYVITRATLEPARERLLRRWGKCNGDDLSLHQMGCIEMRGAQMHVMAAFLTTFQTIYGSIDNFLTRILEFSAADVQQMRQNLIAAAPPAAAGH
ncbi:hypothetical protein N7495_004151 [Penicillium taxi]|uniref:uncharacterized protein n=1 Tax=Penicillium taxi TaxID=168475 RepID=UPI0025452868|nr:uncharacterized protein N7495_004151 [Penicillium taxi]KAJ5899407.1 hypothetical protein N7495_004151 [Penicillium taxi]